jgi:hypothetical protein
LLEPAATVAGAAFIRALMITAFNTNLQNPRRQDEHVVGLDIAVNQTWTQRHHSTTTHNTNEQRMARI